MSDIPPSPSQDDNHELLELEDAADEVPFEWDEGGPSHCGYPNVVHDALMSIGESMHLLFGEPSEATWERMTDVGNYFQEISYAARDFRRGKLSMTEAFGSADDASVATGDEDEASTHDEEAEGEKVQLEKVNE